MKKFLRMFALALFVAVAGIALAACGGKKEEEKQLTAADFVGEWYTVSVVETIGDNEPTTYTFVRLKELHDAGQTGDDEYLDLLTYLPMIKATADGNLKWKQYYDADDTYSDAGTWSYKNGVFSADVNTLLGHDPEVKYENDKIIITQTYTHQGVARTYVYTVARVAA